MLDERDRAVLQELSRQLSEAVKVGRGVLLKHQPWLRVVTLGEEDDIQEVMTALFSNQARILRRYGMTPEYRPSPDALERYVIGVTIFTLRRKYQRRLPAQEEFLDDTAADETWTRWERSLALQAAIHALSEDDRVLFRMIYVEQLDTPGICQRLAIQVDAYYARRSRLVKRLRELLDERRT